MRWTIRYWYETTNSPIEDWFDQLTNEQLKSIAKELKLLELSGNLLRLPHSKALGDGLFELRERRYGYRMYYAFVDRKCIIILAAGNKSSQKRDITLAYVRLADIQRK